MSDPLIEELENHPDHPPIPIRVCDYPTDLRLAFAEWSDRITEDLNEEVAHLETFGYQNRVSVPLLKRHTQHWFNRIKEIATGTDLSYPDDQPTQLLVYAYRYAKAIYFESAYEEHVNNKEDK